MKIPEEFNLFGQTITVEYDDKLINDVNCVGQAIYRENRIVLQKQTNGITRKSEQIEQTFLHELLHFIFFLMGEDELRDNERFIEIASGLLHQFIKTSKGDLK